MVRRLGALYITIINNTVYDIYKIIKNSLTDEIGLSANIKLIRLFSNPCCH